MFASVGQQWGVVQGLNQGVIAEGKKKVDVLRATKEFKKGIYGLQWEHSHGDMQVQPCPLPLFPCTLAPAPFLLHPCLSTAPPAPPPPPLHLSSAPFPLHLSPSCNLLPAPIPCSSRMHPASALSVRTQWCTLVSGRLVSPGFTAELAYTQQIPGISTAHLQIATIISSHLQCTAA